jgi:cysteine desulfurase / selenocysteine lyase
MSTTGEALEQAKGEAKRESQSTHAGHTFKVLPSFDVNKVREDFPILKQKIRGKPLVYFDNAASTQKPKVVVDAIRHTYLTEYANIHRGVHLLSELCTKAYEDTRVVLQHFIHARESREIIFVRGTTEGINLVGQTFGRKNIGKDDEVIISAMEHHSNIVPWQLLRETHGIELRVAPITDAGELDMAALEALLEDGRVGLVAMTHMSNVLGTYTPAARIARIAHAHGAKVLFDGSQAIVHRRVDVQDLDADFYVWTGHKLYGPT